MGKILSFLYGVIAHVGFLAVFMYLVGFLANFAVPKTVDSGDPGPFGIALAVNVLLLAIFGIQHSVMARQGFKRWWTRVVPQHLERSTYVLISDLLFVLLIWQWQPMVGVVWQVDQPVATMILWGLFGIGWLTVVLSSFMINHFDLLGTRQVYLHLIGKEYSSLDFKTKGFYNVVRHPIMVGWIIAFWATPQMSMGHLVFAIGTTVYILIAIQIEERDLISFHGESYKKYIHKVAMILPFMKRGKKG